MNLYIGGNIHSGMDKRWGVNVSILIHVRMYVTQTSNYTLYVHVHVKVAKQLERDK